MSPQAGPSSKRKSSTKKSAPPPKPLQLSKETIASDEDEDDEADKKSSDEADDSPDSEGDIEGVEPRRRANGVEGSGALPTTGKRLARYVPPPGMRPITVSTSFETSVFEYDALASKRGVELWAIRVPAHLKTSRLAGLSVALPSQYVPHAHPSGSLKTKSQTYALVPAGSGKRTHEVVDEEGRQPTAGPGMVDAMAMDVDIGEDGLRVEGGEEMEGGMRLLVPRLSQGGKLFVAPIPIKHHLLLTPQPPQSFQEAPSDDPLPLPSFLSTSVPNATTGSSVAMQGILPGKRAQPTHLLKFRNKAFGYDTPGPRSKMDVDAGRTRIASPTKEKKRKGEGKVNSPSTDKKRRDEGVEPVTPKRKKLKA